MTDTSTKYTIIQGTQIVQDTSQAIFEGSVPAIKRVLGDRITGAEDIEADWEGVPPGKIKISVMDSGGTEQEGSGWRVLDGPALGIFQDLRAFGQPITVTPGDTLGPTVNMKTVVGVEDLIKSTTSPQDAATLRKMAADIEALSKNGNDPAHMGKIMDAVRTAWPDVADVLFLKGAYPDDLILTSDGEITKLEARWNKRPPPSLERMSSGEKIDMAHGPGAERNDVHATVSIANVERCGDPNYKQPASVHLEATGQAAEAMNAALGKTFPLAPTEGLQIKQPTLAPVIGKCGL